jgi:urea transport system permease protein
MIFAHVLRAFVLVLALAGFAQAQEEPLPPETLALIEQLPEGSYRERSEVIEALAETGDSRLVRLMERLDAGVLSATEDGRVVLVDAVGDVMRISDPITGAPIGEVSADSLTEIRVNNLIRRAARAAISKLTLLSDDPATRIAAAQAMFNTANEGSIPVLDEALAQEEDEAVRAVFQEVRAVAILRSDASPEDFAEAVDTIAARGDRQALGILQASLGSASSEVAPTIQAGIAAIERNLALWDVGQNVWYGISLGSVLLLAAIGLAITFGVMGVINMAHGEMVMLGAYTTFVVQELIRTSYPRPLRLVAGDRSAARLSRHRPCRHRHRTRRDPLPLWTTAGNAARHLGPVADHPAGGAHGLRRQQPRGR